MKDYEFLRWLANCDPLPRIPLVEQRARIHAIADQIERLSNASESLYCQLTCGHELWLFNPTIGGTVMCPRCPAPVTVAKIWFKEPKLVRQVCQLSCGCSQYMDYPRVGQIISCARCGTRCARVTHIA